MDAADPTISQASAMPTAPVRPEPPEMTIFKASRIGLSGENGASEWKNVGVADMMLAAAVSVTMATEMIRPAPPSHAVRAW